MASPSSRMLTLLSLLQVSRNWSGVELADRLGVSPRTVRRDVDRLRELGYRIASGRGPDGGYHLAAGSELPPLSFDDDQAVAVALALRVAPASGADIAEAAARALATVRQVLPSRLRHRVDALGFDVPPGSVLVDPDVLASVSAAITARRVLRFEYEYESGSGDARTRRVEPQGIVARRGRWYLVGWDIDVADWRTYRIDRMRLRSHTGAAFVPRNLPGGDSSTFLAARFKGSGGDDVWPCVGQVVVSAAVRELAPYLPDDALAAEGADGRTVLTLGAWSWSALAATIARFDAEFDVVQPDELREAAHRLGRRLRAVGGP
ncbi:helix-turn-helix transcriptional regulator [Planctomonas psychrotolerans]|uniref:helix-turn-helix transcriptional regulator n=1 Tax=Planctomonas psychrotolerans TaxID=2528712 RepID=UPI0012398B4A|nr:WYL domain-containing protein [Planctomonas psychrotolerans]